MKTTTKTTTKTLDQLNKAIKTIEVVKEINISGILGELEKILEPDNLSSSPSSSEDQLFNAVAEYVKGQKELLRGRKTTDNRTGALYHFYSIRRPYF
ncbi:MAG: hypothetical protein KKA62_03735 [Nanoarchaeota archaeon]|nr:hypothetical protein [Nanoarchaeota archaeon]MBU1644576.1 hypothetical protein [Nanoarchaeota archaeon]MBU1977036.1 hypothetical protein [Nanoarchaeota archaeon]